MTQNVNLLCYEIATRIEADNPQDLIAYMPLDAGYKYKEITSNLLLAYRYLVYKEGTQDEGKIIDKETSCIKNIIAKHNLTAKVISVETKFDRQFSIPAKDILSNNPVCLGAYFSEYDNEWEEFDENHN
ncbi:hypothetical protein [Actinobacillus porcinus]|uniref:hypothetical protein n=1 Tax=Actinobacillus porcinus TaxID=51048 RepID=UPI00235699FD|nr:hypothetical protein [Actinobacillus porcinus]